jgi:hypothetical protein
MKGEEYFYYPCSGNDGSVVKFLSNRFQNFIYVDHSYESDILIAELKSNGFKGYSYSILQANEHFPENFVESFNIVLVVEFSLKKNFSKTHGALKFNIVFIKGDGIKTLNSIIDISQNIPSGIAYIQPGLGFGTNRDTYPNEFISLLNSYQINFLVGDFNISDIDSIKAEWVKIDSIDTHTDMGPRQLELRRRLTS